MSETYRNHPVADLFPMMGEDDFRDLVNDIGTNGLLHPIVIFNGEILDGRNRLKACEKAGVRPRFVDWMPPGDVGPAAWIIATNLTRRHLTASQKAAMAVLFLPHLEREAKERQGRRTDLGNVPQKIGECPTDTPKERESSVQAGKMLGVNHAYVSEAKRIREESPEMFERVRTGEYTISKARSELRHTAPPPEPVQTPGFPDGPFRTLVIDPPWPIEKIRFERRPVEKDAMDYPTWTLEQIRDDIPITRLADPRGAHVYLWVTHKFLPEGLRLFDAWGVRYECLLTWYKPTAMPLWWMYNTEHVLFGKVGALPPLVKGKPVGFQAPQQRHSHKPEEFFQLVRTVSPEPRLTLFDDDRDGFERWGIVHAR